MKNIKSFIKNNWENVNEENKRLLLLFITNKGNLKQETAIQYENSIKVFLCWLSLYQDNRHIKDLTVPIMLEYQTWLFKENKLSHSSILYKRHTLSIFFSFVSDFFISEFQMKNIIKETPSPRKEEINKKYITKKEYEYLIEKLKEENKLYHIAYLMIERETGLSLNDIASLKKEIINTYADDFNWYPIYIEDKEKPVKISKDTMTVLKEIIENREDNNEYIFVNKNKFDRVVQSHPTIFYTWCVHSFSTILKREIKPSLIYIKGKIRKRHKKIRKDS